VDPSQLSTLVVAEGTTQAPRTLPHVGRQPCRDPEFYLLLHWIAQVISMANILRQTSKRGELFVGMASMKRLNPTI
jgi:hypothetical protein